jgi:hypothetical protein
LHNYVSIEIYVLFDTHTLAVLENNSKLYVPCRFCENIAAPYYFTSTSNRVNIKFNGRFAMYVTNGNGWLLYYTTSETSEWHFVILIICFANVNMCICMQSTLVLSGHLRDQKSIQCISNQTFHNGITGG